MLRHHFRDKEKINQSFTFGLWSVNHHNSAISCFMVCQTVIFADDGIIIVIKKRFCWHWVLGKLHWGEVKLTVKEVKVFSDVNSTKGWQLMDFPVNYHACDFVFSNFYFECETPFTLMSSVCTLNWQKVTEMLFYSLDLKKKSNP